MKHDASTAEMDLQQVKCQIAAVELEIDQYYQCLLQAFWQQYPPLTFVPDGTLSLETMQIWLQDRCGRLKESP